MSRGWTLLFPQTQLANALLLNLGFFLSADESCALFIYSFAT